MQAASFAGLRVVARIDFGVSIEKVARELLDGVTPGDELLCSERVLDQSAAVSEAGKQRGLGIAHAAGKARSPGRTLAKTRPPRALPSARAQAGVERQLHVVGAGKVPGLGRNVAGLVVDDQQRVVVKPVDAVEAQVEGEARDGRWCFDFGSSDLKGRAWPRSRAIRRQGG